MKKFTGAETKLEKAVQRILNRKVENDYSTESVAKDLMLGGCQSGMIGELIYYSDTVKFYQTHQQEIDVMLSELCDDCGCDPAGLFGDKWEKEDFFAREDSNQNLLAWFGFEEATRRLAERNGIEC